MDRLWIEAAEGRRRFLDRLTLNFIAEHGKAVLDFEKAMRDRNKLLKDGVRDAHWYRALEVQMAESGARITKNRLECLRQIGRAQDEAETSFPTAALDLSGPDNTPLLADKDTLADALAGNRSRNLAAGRTLVGPHRDDITAVFLSKNVPARDCSTGEQKALLISLVLATARALKSATGSAPLVLLDEVSAHLDRARQSALYDEVCILGAQAWMTGTEADLFAPLGARAQHFALPLSGD
jgi:DNA replication and repair protein RecF